MNSIGINILNRYQYIEWIVVKYIEWIVVKYIEWIVVKYMDEGIIIDKYE